MESFPSLSILDPTGGCIWLKNYCQSASKWSNSLTARAVVWTSVTPTSRYYVELAAWWGLHPPLLSPRYPGRLPITSGVQPLSCSMELGFWMSSDWCSDLSSPSSRWFSMSSVGKVLFLSELELLPFSSPFSLEWFAILAICSMSRSKLLMSPPPPMISISTIFGCLPSWRSRCFQTSIIFSMLV